MKITIEPIAYNRIRRKKAFLWSTVRPSLLKLDKYSLNKGLACVAVVDAGTDV